MIIGVSGVAGAGKDLFVQTCINQFAKRGQSAIRYALADLLKLEVRDWCLDHYSIDPFDCPRKEKEKIREFLVFHGANKRHRSKGRHWIEKLSSKIKTGKLRYDHIFISDIRYSEYDKDESYWIQEELKGKLIHVSQYEWREVLDKPNWPKTKIDKVFLSPANAEEKRNDPKIESVSDYKLRWEKVKDINKDKYITSEVVKFIEWITPSIDEAL